MTLMSRLVKEACYLRNMEKVPTFTQGMPFSANYLPGIPVLSNCSPTLFHMGIKQETRDREKAYAAYNRKEVEQDLDPPPFFRTWNRMYAFVLGVFVLLVILFYLFTKWFA